MKQLVAEARELWKRLDAINSPLAYRAWRRWMRRVDTLLDAHGVGYVNKLTDAHGWKSWGK